MGLGGGWDGRAARFERDLERGDEYFIQARIKEFAKGQDLTPEEAERRHRTVAERTLKFYKDQQAAMLVGGAIGVARTAGQTARLGRNLQTGRMESKGKERDAQPQRDGQKVPQQPKPSPSSARSYASNPSAKPTLEISVPGRVQSRINLAKGNSKEGWKHVTKEHYSNKAGKSEFTVTQQELREILQSPQVVQSPITYSFKQAIHQGQRETLRFVREVDVGKVVGIDKFSGRQPTSVITVMTDGQGNLITTTPGKLRVN